MMSQILTWLPAANFVLFLIHVLYLRNLFDLFRAKIYLDMIELIKTNAAQEDEMSRVERNLNSRLRVLQTSNFAPRMSNPSHIKLVPNRKKDDNS